jgi:hypothetical protein
MPLQSFVEFLAQDREERMAVRYQATEEHQQRLEAARETTERQKAETQAKRVPPCDGASPHAVREWIREVDLTGAYTQRTVYVAAHSAQGALRRELEHFLEQRNREHVTWGDVKQHIQTAFLSPHEDDRLRHEVEKIKQGAYETTASYGRRFRESADLAYPSPGAGRLAGRNEDQTWLLLRSYMKGLRDRHVVERLIKEGRPEVYGDAMRLVSAYEADDYRLKRALDEGIIERGEEPMEVGAVSSKDSPNADLAKDMAEMRRQVCGLTQQFTKLMAALQGGKPAQPRQVDSSPRPSGQQVAQPEYQYADDGAPICHFCNKVGHLRRHCRSRRTASQRPQSSDDKNQGGH